MDIIELELISRGSDTLLNLMFCRDWRIGSLIPSLEKRLGKKDLSLRLPTIKSLIEDIILALRDNKMFLSATHRPDLNALNII